MESTCNKEGFLQKAGKRTFQAWRKRWFVLRDGSLRYYNPALEYNDANLLGTIQFVDIQSVVPVKSPKHAFDIVTRSRTYYVSAKSDMERDDWMIVLRKASSSKRGLDNKNNPQDQSQLYSEIPPPQSATYKEDEAQVYEYTTATVEKSKKSKSKSKERVYSEVDAQKCSTTNQTQTIEAVRKRRSQTWFPEASETQVVLTPRSSSQSDTVRANSMLRKLSKDDNENVESMYQELDQKLGETCSSEDEDDAEEYLVSTAEFILPKPHGDGYACDEIKILLKTSDLKTLQQDCDLKGISKQYGYHIVNDDEYPTMSLLKLHLERTK